MSNSRFIIGVLLLGCLVLVTAGAMTLQENDQLAGRVTALENRVQKLESILFATATLSAMEAQQELVKTKKTLRESERLLLRGFVTEAAVQQDRFRVEQAQRQLDLALTQNNQQIIVGEIDLLEAEQNMREAQAMLDHNQRVFDRGYISRDELRQFQETVIRMEKRLDLAKNKANAAKELQKAGQKSQQEKQGNQQSAPDKN